MTRCTADQAHLDAGADASGRYLIDPDGPGGEAPFEIHCDQTTLGGGWALYGTHRDGVLIGTTTPVVPGELGVSTDAHWVALRDAMASGVMFIDEHGRVSMIGIDSLLACN